MILRVTQPIESQTKNLAEANDEQLQASCSGSTEKNWGQTPINPIDVAFRKIA